MKQTGTLTFFCGKMGAGKSTKSKQLSSDKSSVLLSEDDWLSAHYPQLITSFDDYLKYSSLIKPFVKAHVQHILQTGVDVIMDFPANTVKQRNWFKSIFTEINANYKLIFLDVCDETCLSNIEKRGLDQPERAHFDTPEVYKEVTKFFQAPTCDESFNIIKVV